MLAFLQSHMGAIGVGIVDAILILIPSLKSNNVVQLILNALKSISDAAQSKINPPSA